MESRYRMAAAGALGVILGGPALASCGGSAFTVASDASTGPGILDVGPGDAGTEAPAPGDGSPVGVNGSSWCSTQSTKHTFCEDFDEYPNVDQLFSAWSTSEQSGGTFRFDTAMPPSPPNALEATGASGAQVVVVKAFTLPLAPVQVRVAFDLRINSSGSVGFLSAAGIAAIAFGNSISDGYATIAIGGGRSLVAATSDTADAGATDGGGTFKTATASGQFPASGVWAGTYALEVDYSLSAGATVQLYNAVGDPLLSPALPLPPHLIQSRIVSVILGDYAGGFASTGNIDVEFDNVTVDVK